MKIAPLVALIVLLNGVFAWLLNLPEDVGPDVPQGKLNSLSFAPFWEGQGPMEAIFPSSGQLDSDLRLLSEKTHSIRTYASAEGTLPLIPELARKHGLTMIQGAWLGGIDKLNQLEVAELIRSANANPDVVKRVIVGNEVLLRGDLDADEIIKHIREVKKAIKQPVSYADVWSMYLKHPEIIKEVDFVTIHILPYWEDEPILVDEAPAHVEHIYKRVKQEIETIAPGKTILIGESGWPSEGRQRGLAVPSIANEAKFIRGLIKVANANGFDYNIVEAINQSWKSEMEGVVGANWGLFSVNREEVFPLTGKVYEDTDWLQHLLASVGIFLFCAFIFWKPLRALPTLQALGLLALMQLFAVLWVGEIGLLWYTSYSFWQRATALLIMAVNGLTGGLILQRGVGLLSKQIANPKLAKWLYNLFILSAGYAVYKTFGLALNGRYISFPIVAVYIPVIGVLGLGLIRAATNNYWSITMFEINGLSAYQCKKPSQHRLLAYALFITGIGLIFGETLSFFVSRDLILAYPDIGKRLVVAFGFTITNKQLMLWLASLAILALPLFITPKQSPSIQQ